MKGRDFERLSFKLIGIKYLFFELGVVKIESY